MSLKRKIVGAIDCCHIEINAPPDNDEDYFNRKQYYSVNLQAIVHCDLKFIHVSFGYPGSIHNARVLRLSSLFDLGENEQILTSPMEIISGTEIPPLIVGDSAYPLLKLNGCQFKILLCAFKLASLNSFGSKNSFE